MSLRRKRQSGNRGRESDQPSGSATEMQGIRPKQSTQVFVPPATGSVKKSPSVKEYLQDPVKESSHQNSELVSKESESPDQDEYQEAKVVSPVTQEDTTELKGESDTTNVMPTPVVEKAEEKLATDDQLTFADQWRKMADLLFAKLPTVYYTLKEYIPEILDHVVYVKVKNELQKDEIEGKQREMLAYLRAHFDDAIKDIEILVDEHLQSSVKIVDSKEKLNLLKEQNQSLPDFLQILNVNLKD